MNKSKVFCGFIHIYGRNHTENVIIWVKVLTLKTTENSLKNIYQRNRLTTWISEDGLTKNQIDYVLVPIVQKGLIKNCGVFNSADASSDHSLLLAKYTIFLPNVKHFRRQPKRYDVSKLKQQPTLDTLKVQLGGTFVPLINDFANQSAEECYNEFVDDINEATKNMIRYTGETKQLTLFLRKQRTCVKKEEHLGKILVILKYLINLQFRNTR